MKTEMEELFCTDVDKTAMQVQKIIENKYKNLYDGVSPNSDRLWKETLHFMPTDFAIQKNLYRVKQTVWGNMPKGRDDLDISKLLEGLKEEGGQKIITFDSLDFWEILEFRQRCVFDRENGINPSPKGIERVIGFTTLELLNL